MWWPRTAIKFFDFDVTGTLASGDPATLTGVEVALLAPDQTPDDLTVWVAADYAAGVGTVLLAGAKVTSPPANALVIPDAVGADLWGRVVDTPETDVAFVEPFRPF